MGFSEWFNTNVRGFYLKDLFGMQWYTILTIVLLIALGVGLVVGGRKTWNARKLSYAALCLAISFILSCIRLYRMPAGGSVVLCAMLPLVAFSFYCGFWEGLVLCVAYGLLQVVQGAWIVHPIQGILDYIIAFAVLALGGLASRLPLPKRWRLPAGVLIAGIARWAVHVISGVVFFAQDAIDAGQIPFVYSAGYNMFLFPEMILSAIIAFIPGFNRIFKPLEEIGSAR